MAHLLSNNWYLHDKQDYYGIEVNSKALLIYLSYPDAESKKAAKLIRALYEKADIQQDLAPVYEELIQICGV